MVLKRWIFCSDNMKMVHMIPKQRPLGLAVKMKNASSTNPSPNGDKHYYKDGICMRLPLSALTAMQVTCRPLKHDASSYFCRMDKEFMQLIQCFADNGFPGILNHCSNMNNFVLSPMTKRKIHRRKIKWPLDIGQMT